MSSLSPFTYWGCSPVKEMQPPPPPTLLQWTVPTRLCCQNKKHNANRWSKTDAETSECKKCATSSFIYTPPQPPAWELKEAGPSVSHPMLHREGSIPTHFGQAWSNMSNIHPNQRRWKEAERVSTSTATQTIWQRKEELCILLQTQRWKSKTK